jgi:putative MATE family efflux protein
MKNTIDMTKGTPWKVITLFALPILLSNVFQQLYNSIDSLVVGNFISKEALGAVSSSGSLIFLFVSFFYGMSMGAGIFISRLFGEGNYDSMRKAIHTSIAVGLVASIILTVIGTTLSPFILRLIDTPESVLPESIKYFRAYFFGSIGIVMYNMFNAILQALGNSKRPLIYLIISSIINIVLDFVLIAGFHMDVSAAGYASAISQALSAILCFIFLIKKGTIYKLRIREIKIYKGYLGPILKLGIPSGIQNSVIGLANVFVQKNINSFGDLATAGCGSYSKVEGFTFLPITSFTMAITTFISQNKGAGLYKRAKEGAKFGIIASLLLSELIGIIMYIFAHDLICIFVNNEDVIYYGMTQMRICSLFYFLLAFSHAIASVFRGLGKAVVPMAIMLIVWCLIRVTYISVMMHFIHDIRLVFWAYPLTWFISSVIYLILFIKEKDLKKD